MAFEFSFLFGIEIELLMGSRSKNHKSWKSLAAEFSIKLTKAGIPNHVNECNDKALENYEEWSIVQEVTVPSQAAKNLWGLELVSPVFYASSPWGAHLSLIFKTLKSSFTLSPSSNTSTHIHLSTSPPLPPAYLAALSKAILYFEPAIDRLLPSSRASSYWCQSNRTNPTLKPLSLPQCFEYLDYCGGVIDIARGMCLFPAHSAYGRANGYTEDFIHGVYKWDFSGLVDPSSSPSSNESPHGTLEFRQCPGSLNAEDACAWLQLAVGFVAGAIDGVATIDPEVPVTMDGLWWVIRSGIQSSGIGDEDMITIGKLFVGDNKAKGPRK
ncbi:putative amidoligase [Xylariales sp. AK1849]|nr:putative amidoligase [Xylariales sp. AK1849]